MGKYLLKLPKMGESIAEATITKWLKEVGDIVEVDESIVEIATDKVDSDVPSEFKGKLIKKNFEVNDVVKVGDTINFNLSVSGHPFYIKTSQGTGTNNLANSVSRNGSESGTVSWTPNAAGTYYYQCSLHNGMYGTITVN